MVPQPHDLLQLGQHVRYFFGWGPRPRFGRWAYWEKFDYWAVFWGISIIGASGLLLWFPTFFARYLPGWIFNVAIIVHSDEALLAVGFIFTIHFFNGHLRPEKFPMDPVIFTGRVEEEEFLRDHPVEYERLRAEGRLESRRADPPPLWLRNFSLVVGLSALAIGLVLIWLIVATALK
jgi:cytochrome b subunit of formate dehydrogenase